MKTVFIINPVAGQGRKSEALVWDIEKYIAENGADAEIYLTKHIGDATEFVSDYCRRYGPARFIACGGDGTLSEVLNGAIRFKDAEIGVLPMGTGNDFCRNFDENLRFENIGHQINGKTVFCDVIEYRTFFDGEEKSGFAINMFNIGFDCNVADLTAEMKKKPLVSGSLAYFVSIFVMLVKKKCSDLKIVLDGEIRHNGRLLLTSIANGCYCGGGIKSNPLASITDGKISVNIIKNVSRTKFVSLLPHYMKGNFLGLANIEKYITSEKCSEIVVTPKGGHMRLCVDGEISDAGETRFRVVPKAVKFVVPCAQKVIAPEEEKVILV